MLWITRSGRSSLYSIRILGCTRHLISKLWWTSGSCVWTWDSLFLRFELQVIYQAGFGGRMHEVWLCTSQQRNASNLIQSAFQFVIRGGQQDPNFHLTIDNGLHLESRKSVTARSIIYSSRPPQENKTIVDLPPPPPVRSHQHERFTFGSWWHGRCRVKTVWHYFLLPVNSNWNMTLNIG